MSRRSARAAAALDCLPLGGAAACAALTAAAPVTLAFPASLAEGIILAVLWNIELHRRIAWQRRARALEHMLAGQVRAALLRPYEPN